MLPQKREKVCVQVYVWVPVIVHVHSHVCMNECVYKYICISKLHCANEDKKLIKTSQRGGRSAQLLRA